MEKVYKMAITGLKKSIGEIEQQIALIIKSGPSINIKYNLLLSAPGIGPGYSNLYLWCTNNFTNKVSGKQLARYPGLAPFSDTIGTN